MAAKTLTTENTEGHGKKTWCMIFPCLSVVFDNWHSGRRGGLRLDFFGLELLGPWTFIALTMIIMQTRSYRPKQSSNVNIRGI